MQTGHEPGGDKFRGVNPKIDWETTLVHAEKVGLGNREYTLLVAPAYRIYPDQILQLHFQMEFNPLQLEQLVVFQISPVRSLTELTQFQSPAHPHIEVAVAAEAEAAVLVHVLALVPAVLVLVLVEADNVEIY